jgi:predicted flap endonuclease-1-like 5' DNA nuclease
MLMVDRSAKGFFAVFLLVVSLLIFTNLLINPQPLEGWSWIIALVTMALSVFFWIWLWLDTRERRAPVERVSGTGALQLPQAQAREWRIPGATSDAAPSARAKGGDVGNAAEDSPLPFEEIGALAESATGEAFIEGVNAPSTGLESAVEPREVTEAPNLPGEVAVPPTSPAVEVSSEILGAADQQGDTGADAQPKLATQPQSEATAAEEAATTHAPETKMVDLTTGAVDPTEHREEQFVQVTPEETSVTMREAKDQAVESTVSGGEAPIVEAAKAGDPVAQREVGEAMEDAPEKRDTALGAGDAVGQVVEAAPVDTSAADDLTVVEGIGPKFNAALNAAGILTYTQLAATTPEQLREILNNAGYGRVPATYDTWAEQAGYLARGDRGGFDNYVKTLVSGRRRAAED